MISALIIILCVLAVASGRTSALAFALFTILHDQISIDFTRWGYYLSAGASDVAALAIIATLAKPSRMATAFVYICLASLFLNFYGWVLWLSYLSPFSYDISFLALYSIAIYVILWGDDVKNEELDNFGIFPTFRSKGAMAGKALFKEARR